MSLRQLDADLWCAEAELAVAGMPLGIRMTVMRGPGGGLILHSPIEIDDALAAELDALGPVEQLIAPNRMHHLYLLGAARRWPVAKLWGAPGLPAKRRDLIFDGVLGDRPPEVLAETLDTALFAGAPMASEVLCLQRASRTLIVTDLVFNIHHTRSLLSQLYLRANGAWQRVAQTALLRVLIRDRAAARRSLEHVFCWDFDRLIMAHGEVVDTGGKAALAEALKKIAPGLPRG
ncbi:DUF4336 domain-containing protein [Pseudenhygromyxa sp. WMMC2535]|uniref:DUF4336 domain-containing protein n=1 Tax=Pseudenhygromyxa sp. WMMC2535 TaxID=2712867 RepID=UPI001553A3D8|nr:DUF4336 domain-containing protein [Pseudenhygromyxa sp. WMMC2535]NVB41200.1 DUF4336 domain-containing protein [Pseudenhygromyxa sp. WMMC2535]